MRWVVKSRADFWLRVSRRLMVFWSSRWRSWYLRSCSWPEEREGGGRWAEDASEDEQETHRSALCMALMRLCGGAARAPFIMASQPERAGRVLLLLLQTFSTRRSWVRLATMRGISS